MILENSKHKGEVWDCIFMEVYHKSNPACREAIKTEGLKLMKGNSYACHSPEENEPPAIFAYYGDPFEGYETGYIDDIWCINTTKLPHTWFKDLQVGGWGTAIVTYDGTIPPEALILMYEGTGEVDPKF